MTIPIRIRSFVPLIVLAIAAAGVPAAAQPQTAPMPEAPVVYDTDRLTPAFHQSRRDSVMAVLPLEAVAVFLSAPERNRNNDVNYEFRQSSDLLYLTGAHEPGSVLILAPGGIPLDGGSVTELLLVPPRDPNREIWTGRLFGPERAAAQLGIAAVMSSHRYEEILAPLLADSSRRLYHLPLPDGVDEATTLHDQVGLLELGGRVLAPPDDPMARFAAARMLASTTRQAFQSNQRLLGQRLGPEPFEGSDLRDAYYAFVEAQSLEDWLAWKRDHLDLRYADGTTLAARLAELRTAKTDEEVALLDRAIDITAEALREAIKSIEPGMYEYEVEAVVEFVFHRNGAASPAFPSIVGSGENSVILHYESNRRQMQAGDVVVMDVGAEYQWYSADITRTVPVSGTFSPEQRAIYEIVLSAQEAGIAAARAGLPFGGVHLAAFRVVADGLRELGLVDGDEGVRRFFMHGTSHYIGLSLHDVGTYGDLVPGATITVEPGIYISAAPDIDPRWWNIGVRIEDDVLVTDGDPVLLSAGAPRTVADIEALMREQGLGNEPAGVVDRAAPGSRRAGR